MLSPIEIERLLKFNPDDLEYNRKGQLSRSQKQHLENHFSNQRIGAVIFGTIFIGIGLWLIFVQQFFISAVFVFLGALLMISLLFIGSVSVHDLHVQRVSGYLRKKIESDSDSSDYCLLVAETTIKVDKKVYDAFREGETYTLYYFQRQPFSWLSEAPQLVSIETDEIPFEKKKREA